jgi:hypothetical protein
LRHLRAFSTPRLGWVEEVAVDGQGVGAVELIQQLLHCPGLKVPEHR